MPPPSKKRRKNKRQSGKARLVKKAHKPGPPPDPDETGEEAAYLKELTETGSTVVVVLRTGERLRGQLRYYDRDVFSLGQFDGPSLFLRKTSIRYLYEE
jgi:host factor-I protein